MVYKGVLFLLLVNIALEVSTVQSYSVSLVLPAIRSKRELVFDNPNYQPTQKKVDAKLEGMHVDTTVSNRFAMTEIKSTVKNRESIAQEITFSAVLPNRAFISGFVMEIDGTSYPAKVMEKEEAQRLYNQASASGSSSGQVQIPVRDSNLFTVMVSVEAQKKVVFKLTYDELLKREQDKYEVVVNLFTGTFIDDLHVKIKISESAPLRFVGSPPLRTTRQAGTNNYFPSEAHINVVDKETAIIEFSPNKFDQFYTAQRLGTEGYAVQFVVQYDVVRNPTIKESVISDDHFVYFFAPTGLPTLPKHIIFVLDTSGSMSGRKIEKLKNAMKNILCKLNSDDIFNIVEFNYGVSLWDIANKKKVDVSGNIEENIKNYYFEDTYASKENVDNAKEIVDQMVADGGTNMVESLQAGVVLAKNSKSDEHMPLVIYLTDGVATSGPTTDGEEILNAVAKVNSGDNRVEIFSFSFGEDADKALLEKISLNNLGELHHIYDAADSNVQLIHFFDDISSPLLTDVKFDYDEEAVCEVSATEFPAYYAGREIIISGKLSGSDKAFSPKLSARGKGQNYQYNPSFTNSGLDLERLYVYLTIKQKFDELKVSNDPEKVKKEILDIALKYSYVTPVTALVVSNKGNVQNTAILQDAPPPDMTDTNSFNDAPPDAPADVTAEDLEELVYELPWLINILNFDGSITNEGVRYDLGYKKPINWAYACANSRDNSLGTCKVLDKCLHYAKTLRSSDEFHEHFCPIDKYGGICCPRR